VPALADSSQPLLSTGPQWHAALGGWYQSLLQQPMGSARALRHLVRQLILDVCEIREPRVILEWTFSRQASPAWPDTASVCERRVDQTAIPTARLLVWSAGHTPAWRHQLEHLATAALLQDCGFLVLQQHGSPRLAQRHAGEHPTIGMALLSGISDLPMQIPLIVAQHHERSDGLGTPNQLQHSQLLPASRYLAIAVRFEEATRELIGAVQPNRSRLALLVQRSASHLYREAECGAFDLTLTTQFLKHLALLPDRSHDVERPSSGRLIRTDLQHCWPGPHLGRPSPSPHKLADRKTC